MIVGALCDPSVIMGSGFRLRRPRNDLSGVPRHALYDDDPAGLTTILPTIIGWIVQK